MSEHLENELIRLKERVLRQCATVERQVELAVRAIGECDAALARRVIDADPEIDRMEVLIEEEALDILALHQPVAIDLRVIVASIKINADIERIGDLAVNIAERAEYLAHHAEASDRFDFAGMSGKVMAMLRAALDAFVRIDVEAARDVCARDDEVDAMNRAMYDTVKSSIERGSADANTLVHLLSVSRHLERIADHATNIAEEVVFVATGEIVRHKAESYVRAAR
jgi:phosphate transport system protein